LLKAWNTGHPGGIGTVHANSTGAALIRIGQLIQEAGVPAAPELISEAVNMVMSIIEILQVELLMKLLKSLIGQVPSVLS
jgi:Flp pilus assembly CpaF family ATPase